MSREHSLSKIYLVVLTNLCWWIDLPQLYAANSPLQPGEIVISEFFNGMFRVNPTSGIRIPIQVGSFSPGEILEVDNQHRILSIDSTGSLKRFDPVTMSVSTLSTQSFLDSVDMAIEASGTVLVATTQDIYRVNPATMQTVTLVDDANVNDGFFRPAGIAVTSASQIYVSEFFEQAWRVNPQSGAATDALLSNEHFFQNRLLARTSGELVSYDFGSHELKKINPSTRAVTTFSSVLPTFVNSLAIEADNDVLLTSPDGIFRYNEATGVRATLVPSDMLFLPQGIAVVPGTPTTFAADFNFDSEVNGMDFLAWQHGDSPDPYSQSDLLAWRNSYGIGTLEVAVAAVPEPASSLWLASLLVGLAGYRGQRKA